MSDKSDAGDETEKPKPDKEHETVSTSAPAIQDNIWQFSTIALASLLLVFSLATIISPSMLTGAACKGGVKDSISIDQAADRAVNYLNNNLIQQGAAEVDTTNKASGVYAVNTTYQGSNIPIFVSQDGKYLFLKGIEMSGEGDTNNQKQESKSQQSSSEVPTSETPEADLFIFSYCPAGSSSLNSFAPVGKLLSQEADMNVKFFSDMHGAHELQQNKIQLCIQENYDEKYWDYASKFVDRVYSQCGASGSAECDKNKSVALMEDVGIDPQTVMDCVEERGKQLYQNNKQEASDLQLRYSPSFVINGKYLNNIDRTPEGIKQKLCSAFDQAPEDCSESLGSTAAATSGGCS